MLDRNRVWLRTGGSRLRQARAPQAHRVSCNTRQRATKRMTKGYTHCRSVGAGVGGCMGARRAGHAAFVPVATVCGPYNRMWWSEDHPLMWQSSLAPSLTIETSTTLLWLACSLPPRLALMPTLYPRERSLHSPPCQRGVQVSTRERIAAGGRLRARPIPGQTPWPGSPRGGPCVSRRGCPCGPRVSTR